MRLLLDSHALVWWAAYPGRLRSTTRAAIGASENEVYLSAAAAWELGLKVARGKLRLPAGFVEQLLGQGFDELWISVAHTQRAAELPPLHADPFDRLLIAQALAEGMVLVTADREIAKYDVPVMDA